MITEENKSTVFWTDIRVAVDVDEELIPPSWVVRAPGNKKVRWCRGKQKTGVDGLGLEVWHARRGREHIGSIVRFSVDHHWCLYVPNCNVPFKTTRRRYQAKRLIESIPHFSALYHRKDEDELAVLVSVVAARAATTTTVSP